MKKEKHPILYEYLMHYKPKEEYESDSDSDDSFTITLWDINILT